MQLARRSRYGLILILVLGILSAAIAGPATPVDPVPGEDLRRGRINEGGPGARRPAASAQPVQRSDRASTSALLLRRSAPPRP